MGNLLDCCSSKKNPSTAQLKKKEAQQNTQMAAEFLKELNKGKEEADAADGVGENFDPNDLIDGKMKENLYTDEDGHIKWIKFRQVMVKA